MVAVVVALAHVSADPFAMRDSRVRLLFSCPCGIATETRELGLIYPTHEDRLMCYRFPLYGTFLRPASVSHARLKNLSACTDPPPDITHRNRRRGVLVLLLVKRARTLACCRGKAPAYFSSLCFLSRHPPSPLAVASISFFFCLAFFSPASERCC